jgi:hypothetical protein
LLCELWVQHCLLHCHTDFQKPSNRRSSCKYISKCEKLRRIMKKML